MSFPSSLEDKFSTVWDDMIAILESHYLKNKDVQMDQLYDHLQDKGDDKTLEELFLKPQPKTSSANRSYPYMFWPWEKGGWWISIGLCALWVTIMCIVS